MSELGINNVYLGDCLELMKNIPDKSVDMILCDPPYGLIAQEWDKIVCFEKLWRHFDRILKENRVVVIFSSQPFTTMLINSNLSKFRYCWYWEKNQGTNFFHAKNMPIRKIEEICIFGGRKYIPQITDGHPPTNSCKGKSDGRAYFGINIRDSEGGKTTRYPSNILKYKCVSNYSRKHTSQKPVDLLEFLIKTYSDEKDIILDCFSGSGSTLVAAKNINRNFIGIEKEEKYHNICLDRLNKECYNG